MRQILIFLFIYLFTCSANATHDEIINILDKNRIKYNLPVISLSIKLKNADAIKDYVSGKQITPQTLFQMGSITKTFTATIVYQLMEQNKLKLDDTLDKWLPQYPRWNKITITNLLHHTSGVDNYISRKSFDRLLRKNPQKYWSLDELANLAYQQHDHFLPGIKYNYTNTDYVLLGLIIEKATHQSLQQVFNHYFKKYQLNNTFYLVSPAKLIHGYNRDGTFKQNEDVSFVNISFTQSAGGIISTPHDIVKWLHLLFTGKIITDQSLKNMLQVISETDAKTVQKIHVEKTKPFTEIGVGAGIGLLYFNNVGLAWVHSGGTAGYESFYAYNPRNGIYLALAYNVKPKQQLIFIQIAESIFKVLVRRSQVP